MRILGYISVLFCILFVSLNYVNIFYDKKKSRKEIICWLIGVVFAVGLIALITDPYIGDDLSRHFVHIDNFRKYGYSYIELFPYKNDVITLALFYVCSFVDFNNILPFIVSVLFYTAIVIFVIKNIKEEYSSANLSLYFIVISSFLYLNETISSVRYPFALAVFLIVFINDYNKKAIYNFLYVLPLLIHSSSIMFLVLILFCKLVKKYKLNKKIFLSIAGLPYLCLLVGRFFPNNVPILSEIFKRLLIYSDPNFYMVFLDWRVQICFVLCFLIIVFIYNKNYEFILRKTGDKFNSFYLSLLSFCIGVFPFPLIFGRYFSLFVIISLPVFLSLYKLKKEKYYALIVFLIIIICLGLFTYRMVNAIHYWRFY